MSAKSFVCLHCGESFCPDYARGKNLTLTFCGQACYHAHRKQTFVPKHTPSTCHPERAAFALGLCQSCYGRDHRARNVEKYRESSYNHVLRRTYGLSRAQYDHMLREQRGVCAICKNPPASTRRLHVDHCHATGAVRGLLCAMCNKGLGSFRDQPAHLRAAADYIAANGATP